MDATILLKNLKMWRDNMTEFDEDEMDYLIDLVEKDIQYDFDISTGAFLTDYVPIKGIGG